MKRILIAASLLAVGQQAFSSDQFAAGVGISTLGVGISGSYDVSESLIVRAQANHFNYGTDFSGSEIKYDADLKLSSFGLIADWYPGEGGFRVSAGAYYNGNKLEGKGKPKSGGDFIIGDTPYQLDRLDAEVEFNKFAPYLGVGWAYGGGRSELGFSFAADLGVLFQGSAGVDLRGYGSGASAPGFNESLRSAEKNLEDELKNFKYYPVVSASIAYRF